MDLKDSALSILWDNWKISNAHVYDRFNRFLALQTVIFGWALLVLRKGLSPPNIKASEAVSTILLFLIFPLFGIYIVRLMKASLIVRNSHNPEIIMALKARGVLSINDAEIKCEREKWKPTNFSHKWNNWHAVPTEEWVLRNSVSTMRGTTTTMIVVYCLCIIDIFVAATLTYLNIY